MSASLTKTNYVYYQAWKQPLRLPRGRDDGICFPQRYLSRLPRTSPNVKLQNDMILSKDYAMFHAFNFWFTQLLLNRIRRLFNNSEVFYVNSREVNSRAGTIMEVGLALRTKLSFFASFRRSSSSMAVPTFRCIWESNIYARPFGWKRGKSLCRYFTSFEPMRSSRHSWWQELTYPRSCISIQLSSHLDLWH